MSDEIRCDQTDQHLNHQIQNGVCPWCGETVEDPDGSFTMVS